MDWVLNNLDNIIIPIIIMILYGLGTAAQKKDKRGKKRPQTPRAGPGQADSDETRRVEEIQEEIRRKIAERTGGAPPPPPQRPVPANQPSGRKVMPSATREVPPGQSQKYPQPGKKPKPPPLSTPAFQPESHQRELEAKMAKVRELEAQVKLKPIPEVWGVRGRRSVPRGQLRTELFRDLANPLGQRKAILVSEILGSPVGIKGPSGWKPTVE